MDLTCDFECTMEEVEWEKVVSAVQNTVKGLLEGKFSPSPPSSLPPPPPPPSPNITAEPMFNSQPHKVVSQSGRCGETAPYRQTALSGGLTSPQPSHLDGQTTAHRQGQVRSKWWSHKDTGQYWMFQENLC